MLSTFWFLNFLLKYYCPPLKLKVKYHSVTFFKPCLLNILSSRRFYHRNQCFLAPDLLVLRLYASWATVTVTDASLPCPFMLLLRPVTRQTLDHSLAQNSGLCTAWKVRVELLCTGHHPQLFCCVFQHGITLSLLLSSFELLALKWSKQLRISCFLPLSYTVSPTTWAFFRQQSLMP